MKRLLTILLTLAITIGLINLNNSQIKSNDENDDPYQLTYTLIFYNQDWGGWGQGIGWYYNDTKITDSTSPSFNDLGMIYVEGVGGNPGTTTFTKSLTSNSSSSTIEISHPIDILFGGDSETITISNTNNGFCFSISGINDFHIEGNNKKVKLTTGYNNAILADSSNLTLNNIQLESESECGAYATICVKNLTISGNTNIELTNKGANSALKVADSDVILSSSSKALVGNSTASKTDKLTDIERSATMQNHYVMKGTLTYAKYIKTVDKDPSPVPSPSDPVVKDESCEKVIGPTWHWNNTKGICEDYGVVGTYTR